MQTAFAPKLCSKFLCLRHLSIGLIGFFPAYDYLSLASYIYAAPSLETFDLNVSSCSYIITAMNEISSCVVEMSLKISPFHILGNAAERAECFNFCTSCRSEINTRREASQP